MWSFGQLLRIFLCGLDKFAFKSLSGWPHSCCPSLRFIAVSKMSGETLWGRKMDGLKEMSHITLLLPHHPQGLFHILTHVISWGSLTKHPTGYHSCPTGCLQPSAACENYILIPCLRYVPGIMTFSRCRDCTAAPGPHAAWEFSNVFTC